MGIVSYKKKKPPLYTLLSPEFEHLLHDMWSISHMDFPKIFNGNFYWFGLEKFPLGFQWKLLLIWGKRKTTIEYTSITWIWAFIAWFVVNFSHGFSMEISIDLAERNFPWFFNGNFYYFGQEKFPLIFQWQFILI